MPKKTPTILLAALSVLILDQLTKFFIHQNLGLGQSIPLIRNILHFTYVTNTGSAFSLLKGHNLIFILFSLVVIAFIWYYAKEIKENEKYLQIAVGLLLGGTLGNLTDRLVHGFVVDFIDFRIWPVFNVADSVVTISVIFLIIFLWKK